MTLKEWTTVFGENLSEIMDERNMTQQELAAASGLSIGSINAYLHGQTPPGIKAIINLSYALDAELSDLLDFGDVID